MGLEHIFAPRKNKVECFWERYKDVHRAYCTLFGFDRSLQYACIEFLNVKVLSLFFVQIAAYVLHTSNQDVVFCSEVFLLGY